jgi:predicted acyl esterase
MRVGPWVHIPWSRTVGDVDFGPAADSDIDLLQLGWFDHWLKGIDTGVLREKPVRLFENGGRGVARLSTPGRHRHRAPSFSAARAAPGLPRATGRSRMRRRRPAKIVLSWIPGARRPRMAATRAIPAGRLDRAAIDARADCRDLYDAAPGRAISDSRAT